jgi:hypothetical protein
VLDHLVDSVHPYFGGGAFHRIMFGMKCFHQDGKVFTGKVICRRSKWKQKNHDQHQLKQETEPARRNEGYGMVWLLVAECIFRVSFHSYVAHIQSPYSFPLHPKWQFIFITV